MSIDAVFQAARDGLDYERLRLDAASRNIAGANTPIAAGEVATQWAVASGSASLDRHGSAIEQQPIATREVHDPAHPMADANGQVRFADVDLVHEMTTLMTASRGYEANVRSFNLLRSMMLRALEIGAK